MKTKKLAGAAAVGTFAVTTLLLGATPALAQDSKTDSAFALEASGVLDINKISQVKSTNGKLVHDELLSIGDVAGEYEDDISFGLLTAEAEANRAETAVKEVNLLNILRADLIRTWCEDGEGGLEIVNGTVLGQKLPDTSVPSEEIDLSPLVKLSLNDQKRHSDGSLTVRGIELTVLPGAGEDDPSEELSSEARAALPVVGDLLGTDLTDSVGTVGDLVGELGGTLALDGDLQKITIGSATCQDGDASGNGDSKDDGDDDKKSKDKDDDDDDDDDDDGDNDSDVKTAPSPSVVQAALPVTG